jgi:hypothetical protein
MGTWRLALIGCFASFALVVGGTAVSAQDAGGITQCLVGCAKQRSLTHVLTPVWHIAAAAQKILIS